MNSLENGWIARRARKLAFGVSPSDAEFARRGFHCRDDKAREHLERIGKTAAEAFNIALDETRADRLGVRLEAFDRELWGYAYEGAAMALTVLDCLTPWRKNRVQLFLNGPGAAHIEIVHVGIGFALARLHRNAQRALSRLDPMFGWLAVDGYGFHEGYYHWHRYAGGSRVNASLSAAGLRVFDQGLGRSLWFIKCADAPIIAAAIAGFPPDRSLDLWSGVGVACAYAGGVDRRALEALQNAAGSYRPGLAEGACFAAKARRRGGSPAAHTAMACELFCGKSVDEAAAITDEALGMLPAAGAGDAYESWRRQVRARFESSATPRVVRK